MLDRVLAGYSRWKHDPVRRMRKRFANLRELVVVQIGASGGPAARAMQALLEANPNWKALFVEPVPSLFERLKKNYGGDRRFVFENALIAQSSGETDFFYISPEAKRRAPHLPENAEQIGAASKGYLLNQFPELDTSMIAAAKVRRLSFADLLAKHGISQVHLLHLDTRGHDWTMLQQIDLEKFAPEVILLENRGLRLDQATDALNSLTRFYRVEELAGDWFCTRLTA